MEDVTFEHVVRCRTGQATGYFDDSGHHHEFREAQAAVHRQSVALQERLMVVREGIERDSQERLLGDLLGLREKLRDGDPVTYTITLEWETSTKEDVIDLLRRAAAQIDPNLRVLSVE